MSKEILIGILVFLVASLMWAAISLHDKDYTISGQAAHNSKKLCKRNGGLDNIRLDSELFYIQCENGASFTRNYQREP